MAANAELRASGAAEVAPRRARSWSRRALSRVADDDGGTPPPGPEPLPQPTPEPVPQPTPEPIPQPTPEPIPQPTPEPIPQPTPDPVPPPASGSPAGPPPLR